MTRTWIITGAVLAALSVATVAVVASGDGTSQGEPARIPQATPAQLAVAGLDKLPLAPLSDRVDLTVPAFSNPTRVDNPRFPISSLHSAILNGRVDGKPFKVETTLLPETRIVQWPAGRRTEALVSQYVAFSGDRIKEVALDFYVQADDGSVWYLGEDVFNYRDGIVEDLDGTWLAGREGPGAMIMPADPKPGDVYLPENIPGFVFEQVTVEPAGGAVDGPRGPVDGAIVARELHQDGSQEKKTFAPGYGEFFTGSGGDVEALALAVPIDRATGPAPGALAAMKTAATRADARAVSRAWRALEATELPPRLRPDTDRAVKALARARGGRDASLAAIGVGQAVLDLELRHRPPVEIDRERFELWARQVVVDAAAGDHPGVAGDVSTLEWIRDRFAHTVGAVELTRLDTQLVRLRTAVAEGDLEAAAAEAGRLRESVARS